LLVGYLARPPSASILTKYKAPLIPQPGRWVSSHVRSQILESRILTKARDVNVKGEFLVLQLEQFVLVAVDQVDTRSDVVTLFELQADRVAAGLDTVGTRVVCKRECGKSISSSQVIY